jgi:hypothetical protein
MFDPAHTGRKPHNAFQIKIMNDGQLKAERYGYLWEEARDQDKIHSNHRTEEGRSVYELSFPVTMLGNLSENRRVVGFNIIHHVLEGEKRSQYRWSGLTGDVVYNGQGAGDLLFAYGLTDEEVGEWKQRAAKESETAFTQWKKQSYPEQLLEWITPKKQGFTIRIGREDAKRARHQAEPQYGGERWTTSICGSEAGGQLFGV